MTRMICLRASSDFKKLTKHENAARYGMTAPAEKLCDTPQNLRQAGAFVFNSAGAVLSSPFVLAGKIVGGN